MRSCLLTLLLLLAGVAKAQDIDVLHYSYALNLSDQHDTIRCAAAIRFLHRTNNSSITFDLAGVKPNGKGMKVQSVSYLPLNAPTFAFRQENDKLFIQLPLAKKGDTQTVKITYAGIPDDGLIISKNKFGDRTFFADNWPNRAHRWIPCIDRPDDKAAFEFAVSAPPAYRVISNGIQEVERILPAGNKLTYWKEDVPCPTKVMVIGVAKFATKVYDSTDGIPVSAWVYPQDSTKGFYDFGTTVEILKFFTRYIAPFPYKKLANVQSTTIFGGMENASAIFYGENSITGDRSTEGLLAHEIAHQWFGDMASEKSFKHVWLSEGFATYLTHLYFEKTYGPEELKRRLQNDREEIIDFARKNDRPVVDSNENLMSLLNVNTYQKGGWVLHMLRNEVGDAVFQKIIQTYYHQYKGGNAETKDFQRVAEEVSGKDLNWFFEQWLYRPGIPKLMVQTVREGSVQKLKIIQTGTVYRLPLTIHITSVDGRMVKEQLLLTGRETESTWRGKSGAPVQVVLDPNTTLLLEESKKQSR